MTEAYYEERRRRAAEFGNELYWFIKNHGLTKGEIKRQLRRNGGEVGQGFLDILIKGRLGQRSAEHRESRYRRGLLVLEAVGVKPREPLYEDFQRAYNPERTAYDVVMNELASQRVASETSEPACRELDPASLEGRVGLLTPEHRAVVESVVDALIETYR